MFGVQDANDEVFSLNEKLAAAEAELAAARAGQEELRGQLAALEATATAHQQSAAAAQVSCGCCPRYPRCICPLLPACRVSAAKPLGLGQVRACCSGQSAHAKLQAIN